MRSLLCVSLVFLFATVASAQIGKNGTLGKTARATDATQRKLADKGRTDRGAKAADQASADADLANALLAAMDTDGDGMVTKIEMAKAMAALRKVPKDTKGNMILADKPADAGNVDPTAAAGPEQAQNGAGVNNGAGGGRGNETLGRFMQYDRNRDGRLTPDEVPPQAMAMLRGGDLNGDGAIDARELAALAARMGEQMRALGANPGAGPGAGINAGPGGPGNGGPRPPRNDNN